MTDIQQLWLNQKMEDPAISVADIRARVGKFRARILWRNILTGAFLLTPGLYYLRDFIHGIFSASQGQPAPAGFSFSWPVFLTFGAINQVVTWSVLIVLWQCGRARVLPGELKAEAALDFYRHELERQRAALLGPWSWFFLPLVLLSAVMPIWRRLHPLPHQPPRLLVPENVLLNTLVFIAIWCWCRYSASKLELELERLKRLRTE